MPLTLKEHIARIASLLPQEPLLWQRAGLLEEIDRELLKSVLLDGLPVSRVSRLMGQPAVLLRRRVRRLLNRLQSPEFLAAARSLPHLDGRQGGLARMILCQGLSLRQAARILHISYFEARTKLMEVNAVISRLETNQPAPPDPRRWLDPGKPSRQRASVVS
jgi:transposase InsO family protein